MTAPASANRSTWYLQLPPGAEHDLATVLRERLRHAFDRHPVIISVGDVATELAATSAQTRPDRAPVETWIGYLLAWGLAADQITVYRRSRLPALATGTLLLGRWLDVSAALGPGRRSMSATAVTVLNAVDLLAAAADGQVEVAVVPEPSAVARTLVESAAAGAPIPPLPCALTGDEDAPTSEGLDTRTLRYLRPLSVTSTAEEIRQHVRRIPTHDIGTGVRTLHEIIDQLDRSCRCNGRAGYEQGKTCLADRLLTIRDEVVSGSQHATQRDVATVSARSHHWATERQVQLSQVLWQSAGRCGMTAITRKAP